MEERPSSKIISKELEEILVLSEKDISEGKVISQEELDRQDLKWLTGLNNE